VPVGREVAEVVHVDIEEARANGFAEEALPERALEDGREDREDVDAHERRLALPEMAADRLVTAMGVSLEPIGVVRTTADDDQVRASWEGLESAVEVFEPYGAALEGLDGFSHLFVLTFLDRITDVDRTTVQVKPRGLLRLGLSLEELPTIGVFACDSPVRPNPIGLSIVRLVRREGLVLTVRGLDAFDGTPVLDVKPYGPDRVVAEPTVPRWHRELSRRARTDRI
jgi:tRNA-Thr(GGU) m(6)t(6)A37 methyltransferase TsaA